MTEFGKSKLFNYKELENLVIILLFIQSQLKD